MLRSIGFIHSDLSSLTSIFSDVDSRILKLGRATSVGVNKSRVKLILGATIINYPRTIQIETMIMKIKRRNRSTVSPGIIIQRGLEEATLWLLNSGKLSRFSNVSPTYLFFFLFLFFLCYEGWRIRLDHERARCLLASSSNGLMGFETAQRHRVTIRNSLSQPFSQPHRDSPKADSVTLLSKLVSLLAIDCEKGEVSTCVSSAEGLPVADRV